MGISKTKAFKMFKSDGPEGAKLFFTVRREETDFDTIYELTVEIGKENVWRDRLQDSWPGIAVYRIFKAEPIPLHRRGVILRHHR